MPVPPPRPPRASPSRGRLTRRLIRGGAIGCVLLLALLLAFPLWSPWIAPTLARWLAGVEIEELDSSWSRWTLSGLSYEQEGLRFEAASVELPSPTGWLLAQAAGKRQHLGLSLDDWRVALRPAEERDEAPTQAPTPHALFEQINQGLELLERQLGSVSARNGQIEFDGQLVARVDRVTTNATGAELVAQAEPRLGKTQIELDRANPQRWILELQIAEPVATLRLEIEQDQQQLQIDGSAGAFANTVALSAHWDSESPLGLPDTARLGFDHLQIDHGRFEFWPENLPIDLRGEIAWSDESYRFEVHSLETARLQSEVPHMVHLAGSGTLRGARLEQANIHLPWLTAASSAPLEFDFSQRNPLSDAALELAIDFQELPWVEGSGKLGTRIEVSTSSAGEPVILATAESQRIELFDTIITSLGLQFRAEGRRLILESLEAATERGSLLSASASANLDTAQIESLSVQLNLENESQRLQQLIPFVEWEGVSLDGAASGSFDDPRLSVNLAAGSIKLPSVHALDLELAVAGSLRDLEAELTASRDQHRLELAVHSTLSADGLEASIGRLRFSESAAAILDLQNPAQLSYQFQDQSLRLTDLVLIGPEGSDAILRLSAFEMNAQRLAAVAAIRQLSTALIEPWVEVTAPPLDIEGFVANFRLSEVDSRFDLALQGVWRIDADNEIQAAVAARQLPAQEPQLQIEQLEVGAAGRSFFRAQGLFPLGLGWSEGKPQLALRDEAPISLSLDSSPNPDFWTAISDLLPVSLERPMVTARFEGSLAEPRGTARLELASARWSYPDAPGQAIAVEDVRVELEAEPNRVRLTSATARLGQNRFEATGHANLRGAQIEDLLSRGDPPRLEDYAVTARVNAGDLEAFRAWLPDFVRSRGGVQVEATFKPDELRARARIQDLSTRPMPPLGSFSEVSGDIELNNGRVTIHSLAGLAEQSPFQIAGSVDLRDWNRPRYDLSFSSLQFPLVRQSGMLMEGDINVSLVSGESEHPDIRGSLRLTKGLILTEPELLAGSTRSARQRPPYFSVDQDPFSQWGLNIEIIGNEFLRVSNSFFQGTLSADFLLDGTLENPLLIGKATTANGRIFFPATALRLTSGEAYITRERPSEIQINARAEGSLYDYQISLEVDGDLEDPQIDITTNPALTQTEALVFVTTGALPEQGGLARQSASSIGLFLGKGLFRKLVPSDPGAGERLRLEIGRDTSEQGRRVFEAAYRLTDDLEVEGEYNRNDEYNANLKWTFFER